MTKTLLLILCSLILMSCSYIGIKTITTSDFIAKYAKPEDGSAFLRIDGRQVHYRVVGKGPIIVALHGISASLHTWTRWSERLKGQYRIVSLDVPGFGLSDPIDAETPDQYVSYLNKIFNRLGIKKLHIVGNSFGGYLAWNYAVRFPDKVEKLVVIDPAAYPLKELPWMIEYSDELWFQSAMSFAVPRFVTAKTVESVYGDPRNIKAGVIDLYQDHMLLQGNKKKYIDMYQLVRKNSHRLPKNIKVISVPTLVLWGENDRWLPVEQAFMWKRDLPHAKVVVYSGIGHIPQEEIPDKTAADVLAFLKDKPISYSPFTELIVQ
jgi:pimeloyl-ACP methyl ester carboxylesterase